MDDDEEILIEMAQTLDGSFLQYVGGPLFAPHLFKPLERLCEVEEPTVREKVSKEFKMVVMSDVNLIFGSHLGGGKH